LQFLDDIMQFILVVEKGDDLARRRAKIGLRIHPAACDKLSPCDTMYESEGKASRRNNVRDSETALQRAATSFDCDFRPVGYDMLRSPKPLDKEEHAGKQAIDGPP
jgi:hypothetical protein